jgi:hypothetical protein
VQERLEAGLGAQRIEDGLAADEGHLGVSLRVGLLEPVERARTVPGYRVVARGDEGNPPRA